MIGLSKVASLNLYDGMSKKKVEKIKDNGKVIWDAYKYRYVSLGDSIAAGHTINENWDTDYGWDSQYGYKYNDGTTRTEPTVIVPDCYTHRIEKYLQTVYKEHQVKATSFSQSGERVASLITKLRANKGNNPAANAIRKANIVTLCIGANDVLIPAMNEFGDYVLNGKDSLDNIKNIVETSIGVLAGKDSGTSYYGLFNELTTLNPNAKFVFTTVYNPYKYLWLDEGTDGFFKPILDEIPQMTLLWGTVEVDEYIKANLLKHDYVQLLFDRVNGLCDWVEDRVNSLNATLKQAVKDYNNTNIIVADTKALFDTIPNRNKPYSSNLHYNDLVSVEYTKGYDTAQMKWDRLWAGSTAGAFWNDLIYKHFVNNFFDFDGLVAELIPQVITKVIMPDMDPHPEIHGHCLLYRSFADALGWQALKTITYNANGGTGSMSQQKVLDKADDKTVYSIVNANTFKPATGYYFTGWKDQNGNDYSNGQPIPVTSNLTLYAQWSNVYNLYYYKSNHSTIMFDDSDTGSMELRTLTVNGSNVEVGGKFGEYPKPSNPAYMAVTYGTPIVVSTKCHPDEIDLTVHKDHDCVISCKCDGTTLKSIVGTPISWKFDWSYIDRKRDIIIDFQSDCASGNSGWIVWYSEWWDVEITVR